MLACLLVFVVVCWSPLMGFQPCLPAESSIGSSNVPLCPEVLDACNFFGYPWFHAVPRSRECVRVAGFSRALTVESLTIATLRTEPLSLPTRSRGIGPTNMACWHSVDSEGPPAGRTASCQPVPAHCLQFARCTLRQPLTQPWRPGRAERTLNWQGWVGVLSRAPASWRR